MPRRAEPPRGGQSHPGRTPSPGQEHPRWLQAHPKSQPAPPGKHKLHPGGLCCKKRVTPPHQQPRSKQERKRGEKREKSRFWWEKATREGGEVVLVSARLLRWGRHPRAQPNQQTRALPPRVLFVPKTSGLFVRFWGANDPVRGFLQFCPGSPEGSAGRKQQKAPVLGRNTKMGK